MRWRATGTKDGQRWIKSALRGCIRWALSHSGLESPLPGVIDTIIEQARLGPNLSAVKDAVRELTYAELVDESARHASGLAKRGVGVGDRVGILMPNSADFVVAALACLRQGAIFVPLAPSDPVARLTTIVEDCAPKLVISQD